MTRLLTLGLLALLLTTSARGEETPARKMPPATDNPEPAAKPAPDAIARQLEDIRLELLAQRVAREEERKNLDVELKLVRERLTELERRVNQQTRQSASFTPSNTVPLGAPTGTVRLQNRSGVPATVVLSGRTYRLSPLESIVLPTQPTGSFTYEVLAEGYGTIRDPQTRTLVAGEVFTITVNP